MKQLFLCLLFFSQTSSAETMRIIDWIDYFSDQGLQIFHSSDYLSEQDKQVLINLEPSSFADFKHALQQHSLTITQIDSNTFVIQPYQINNQSVSGVLLKLSDAETGLNIPLFNIIHKNKKIISENGVVLLDNIKDDTIEITTSADGYYPIKKTISIKKNQYISTAFQLNPKPLNIDKIVVTASKTNLRTMTSGKNSFQRKDLENATIMGNDPLRSNESLAGNTSTGISSKSRTRGGQENESLIVLDNHVLRNPYHFKNFYSLFSTINLSVVDNIDFYSGVFPMQYGGKLSSVMNIQTGDNINQSNHEVGLDFLNAYYTYRHSNDDYSQQFQGSFRTGGHLINDHIIGETIFKPEFDDAYLKYFQQINSNWSSSQHILVSRDHISIDDTEFEGDTNQITGAKAVASNHDQNLWLQWHYDNDSNNSANIQFYAVRKHDARTGFILNNESNANVDEDILTRYFGIKYQQNITATDHLAFNLGTDIYREETEINSLRNINHFGELVQQLGLERQTTLPYSFINAGNAANIFVNGRYQHSEKLIIDLGYRMEYKEWIDEVISSPRLNMSYFYDDKTVFRFALGRHQQSQHIDELLLEDNNPNYFDPTSADVAVFEYNRELLTNIDLRAELYFKKYSSTQPYYENLFNSFHVIPDLYYDRTKINPDDSQASGLEVTLNGTQKDIQWSVSYAYSDVEDIFNDEEVPRSWDQHNAIKFNLHKPLNWYKLKNWQLNFGINYHSGWAKTGIRETDNGLEISERNIDTYKDFYQFDLNLSKHNKTKTGDLFYSVQINNLFNTRNTCCIDYQLEDNELIAEKKSWLPIAPNFSIIYKW